jgi:predicted ATPase
VVVLALAALAAVGFAALARRRAPWEPGDAGALVTIDAPPIVDPASAEGFWTNLHGILTAARPRRLVRPARVALECTFSQATLRIALWVQPGVPTALVERAVEAAWPAARTTTTLAGPVLPYGVATTMASLRLALPPWWPLRTDHPLDPLRALLAAGTTATPGETVVVQVVARPAPTAASRRLWRQAAVRRASGAPQAGRTAPRRIAQPTTDADWRAALDKSRRLLWRVAIRCAATVTAPSEPAQARVALEERVRGLVAACAAFTGANALRRVRVRGALPALLRRELGPRPSLLGADELAALCHLPHDPAVAGLARAGAKSVPPPPGVAQDPAGGKVLGDADAGARLPVVLRALDACQHLHVIGATGSGKSTLLVNLALQDIRERRGVVVVDPKGDLVTDILDRLTPRERDRAVVLDPQAKGEPPSLNVLEVPEGVDEDLVVDQLVGIFRRIFTAHWGPRTDDVMRSACKTLVRSGEPASLDDVPKLLTDAREREARRAGLDPDVDSGLEGFWRWYEAQSEGQQAQVIGSVLNKLRAFLLRDFVRQVVGRESTSLNMTHVLDGERFLLVRVPKGVLGDDTARLLGSFVVARVWQAGTGRSARPHAQRRPASIYIDECQNFLTLPRSFDEMLAEARGYGLALVLAHQHLGQLPRELREALSTNARNKLFFSLSPEDALALSHHVTPELSVHDLANLGRYQAACRLVVEGAERPAFTLATRPATPPEANPENRADNRADNTPEVLTPPGSERGKAQVRGAAPPEVTHPDSHTEST